MIFVSYASADDEDQSDVVGDNIRLSLIKRILFEIFKGDKVPGCNFSAGNAMNGVYFFAADKRTDPVNVKLIKEIRSRPIMITFLSQNYFKSAACRFESLLFKDFYGSEGDYPKRHIFIDLDNIMAKYTVGDDEFGPDNNVLIEECISQCVDETDRKWVQSLYQQIQTKNAVVVPFFEKDGGAPFCDPLSFDFPMQKTELLLLCKKVRGILRRLLTGSNLKQNKGLQDQHIHISANAKDVPEAVEVAKLLWPDSLITSPPFIRIVSDGKTKLVKLQMAEEEYLSNCHQHIMFTSSSDDEKFVETAIENFRKAKQNLVQVYKNNLVLVANDNASSIRNAINDSDDYEISQIELQQIPDKSATTIISFLRDWDRWGVL